MTSHGAEMIEVTERAARAEGRAEVDSQTRDRMSRLQERLQGLTTEVRAHKQREEAAKRSASENAEAAHNAESIASRTSAELGKLLDSTILTPLAPSHSAASPSQPA